MKQSLSPVPNIKLWVLGLPTIDGKELDGASSPANPALHIPLPLSITTAV